ncbi:hypothetical protein glysoja_044765 [Glycine soja]|uniref:Uncharacterized protein n=1 Tax=Glycine soja TaxID=3848 RepID=A0A0B2S780_GLYSO|nr:hypothetical protein glysoja_044765 [Glycine soja]
MNPFGNLTTNNSSWPVLLMIYNIPPWLCMKRKYIMLSMMIACPKQPGNDIDVYLSPLIEDLRKLWVNRVDVYDANVQDTFKLRVMVFCTVNDFPPYGNLSGYSVKGHHACPICYQFDYIFYWTIWKYPQIGGSSSKGRWKAMHARPSVRKPEKVSVGKEIREKFSGAVEAFSRRNPTSPSPRGDHSKHRSFEEVAVHKDVYHDQEKGRNSSRYGSSSRRPIIPSSTRPSSSGDHTDSHTGQLSSSGNRPSTSHRNIQPMYETKQPTYMHSRSTRGNRDAGSHTFIFFPFYFCDFIFCH